MNTETQVSAQDRADFYSSLIPFGYMDVTAAIETAQDAGKGASWAGEIISGKAEEYGMRIDQLDPVAAVYESLLQEFRTELEEVTGFDFENDSEAKTGLYVAGNFMATSFDYSEDAREEIISYLKENKAILSDMSEESQWVLNQINIDQKDVDDQ